MELMVQVSVVVVVRLWVVARLWVVVVRRVEAVLADSDLCHIVLIVQCHCVNGVKAMRLQCKGNASTV
ncbi:hypothetical protein PRBRB14_09630 [Hallella multisaccharivorax DSM 17128]|nr:hypothetical protein PRBRB14_09630 [Hallella multisaccharivorax DSM 17128]